MSTDNLDTRNRILEAALRLLLEQGGKGVRMSDIAKAANVSRQAVYLHFDSRSNLMVSTVQYADQLNDAEKQVRLWREAEGIAKLDTWIEFWGNYIPQIFGVAKALLIAKESDEAANAAWKDRMSDIRRSCRKTVNSLVQHDLLAEQWNSKTATDLLWTLLSISNWEQFTQDCKWTNRQYVKQMKTLAKNSLLK